MSESAYFRAVEEDFVSRRGGALMLSTADWHLIWKWHHARVPLRVVLRGIADAFEAHAHSLRRKEPVRGLRYCADEVEKARARWRRALALDRAESLQDHAHLKGLAESWRAAALPAQLEPARAALLTALEAGPAAGEDLQAWLVLREGEARHAVAAAVSAEERTALQRAAEADMEKYRGRMPPRTFERIIEEGVTRRLFERFKLPRPSFIA